MGRQLRHDGPRDELGLRQVFINHEHAVHGKCRLPELGNVRRERVLLRDVQRVFVPRLQQQRRLRLHFFLPRKVPEHQEVLLLHGAGAFGRNRWVSSSVQFSSIEYRVLFHRTTQPYTHILIYYDILCTDDLVSNQSVYNRRREGLPCCADEYRELHTPTQAALWCVKEGSLWSSSPCASACSQ